MTQQTHTGFQTLVNTQPAPGQAGDFYGVNPRAVVLAANVPAGASGAGGQPAQGQLVAPAGGLTVGNFAWADLTTGLVSQSYDANGVLGLLHRDEQAIIVTYLGISTYVMNAGFPVTLFSQADMWAKFAAGATPGQKVYADPRTGAPIAGATTPAVASVTGSVGAAVTGSVGASFTGVVATNVLTASAVTGYLSQGDIVTGAGVAGIALGAQLTGTPGGAGTYTFVHADVSSEALTSTSTVLDATAVTGLISVGDTISGGGFTTATVSSQISGTAGGVGLYQLSGSVQSFASGALTDSSTIFDVTAVGSGALQVGDILTGPSGSPAITSQISGTAGGVGLYQLNGSAVHFASGAVTVGAIATPWKVKSKAGAGEVAKISTWGK